MRGGFAVPEGDGTGATLVTDAAVSLGLLLLLLMVPNEGLHDGAWDDGPMRLDCELAELVDTW